MVDRQRDAFSNYNIVRMREAVRYLSDDKLEIFIKIPFLIHINSPDLPGYCPSRISAQGIWDFENSGFYKEAVNKRFFPKSVIETTRVIKPAVLGLYHMGSLGTFTQSEGSDFDYWVIIDNREYSDIRYCNLQQKLDDIVKYAREAYSQEVSFFIMDHHDIKNNCYAAFRGEEIITAPKIFLKEEFYRTFLRIAGKIPLWSILPDPDEFENIKNFNAQSLGIQVLSMYDDLLDLGHIHSIPGKDILKGILWHICKSAEDPVKALIKATMIFSCAAEKEDSVRLLCDDVKKGYANAGIDDYAVDPYKALFDRIIQFHMEKDPKGLNLIKNAIFFRLCNYPDVSLPPKNTPKRQLLEKYMNDWSLNHTQVAKLTAFTDWSEHEKLLLEKTLMQRLAQMYNHAIKTYPVSDTEMDDDTERRNWVILKNRTRERLVQGELKVQDCSIYLKRRSFTLFHITKSRNLWILDALTQSGKKITGIEKSTNLSNILGWIFLNGLYSRKNSSIKIENENLLFESAEDPVDPDRLYVALQPLKPMDEKGFEHKASCFKMIILLVYEIKVLKQAEFMISDSWGQLFIDTLSLTEEKNIEAKSRAIADKMGQYRINDNRCFIYQFSPYFDPSIVYHIKKACDDMTSGPRLKRGTLKKPYLDRL